jgi:hypothetical protein
MTDITITYNMSIRLWSPIFNEKGYVDFTTFTNIKFFNLWRWLLYPLCYSLCKRHECIVEFCGSKIFRFNYKDRQEMGIAPYYGGKIFSHHTLDMW